MSAIRAMRAWPLVLRPFVYRFIPEMRLMRELNEQANRLLSPHVAIRRRARLEAIQSGNPPPEFKDALGWLDETAGDRPYNVVYGQLMISLASMHSTSSTLMALMYHLLENPSYLDMLRQEMVEVLQEHGSLSKASLYKLKLLDSCMKESQRLTSVNARMYHFGTALIQND